MEIVVTNSFCQLKQHDKVPPKVQRVITKALTYRNDIHHQMESLKFAQIWARRKKDSAKVKQLEAQMRKLKATEVVCWYKDGKFPTGHLKIVESIIKQCGHEYTLNDKREIPVATNFFKWVNRPPYERRPYQKEILAKCLDNGRGVVESAVGSGKSLMAADLIKELGVNTLFIVPSSGLSDQIFKDFRTWFGAHQVEIINTKAVRAKKALKPIRIITIQSLASLNKSNELDHLTKDIGCVVVDEFHHAGSESFVKLLPKINNIYYRFGFTGTFLRNDGKTLDMWGFLSNVLYRYSAAQAISEGYLTPIEVKIHELGGSYSKNYQKEYKANYCHNPALLSEIKNIVYNAEGKQILILVTRKEDSGHLIHEFLKRKGIESTFISGDNSKEEITEAIQSFNDLNTNILIGSTVVGEGINIASADHLILCQGGKSEIQLVQAVGRLVRLYPGKEIGVLHDFNFTGTKYMGKHLKMRLEAVEHNFAPLSIDKV